MKDTQYPFAAYDRYLCLNPPAIFWVMILFLMRPALVFGLSFTQAASEFKFIGEIYADGAVLTVGAILAIPALLVLFLATQRQPDAKEWIRTWWPKGRAILIGLMILNLAVILAPVLQEADHILLRATWVQTVLCLYFTWELFMSQYLKDCFNDFPAVEDDD